MKVHRSLAVLALAVVAAGMGGCTPTAQATPTSCDGISAKVGGCDASRPSFTATTCDGVAAEFGKQINDRVVPVFAGPASVNGKGRSVQIATAMSLTASLANLHLRAIGLRGTCDLDQFLQTAEMQFSGELKSKVGQFAYDGNPVIPYDQWLVDVREAALVIRDATASPS